MKIDRWKRVKELVAGAAEMEPPARAGFLDRECMGDVDLRAEVESLLRSLGKQPDFIETPAIAPNVLGAPTSPDSPRADFVPRPPPSPVAPAGEGRRVGAYRLEGVIASGGMGTVYTAVRADDAYQQRVAIKLIRSSLFGDFGLDDPQRHEILKRFRAERQMLADLDHPNICRLLDGGTTDDGSPYLVMEYIQGRRIDEHCDAHSLSITDRLKLFRQVCAAVQYAHQRLVIHRDLKPSNVLVTEGEVGAGGAGAGGGGAGGGGVPRLVDFGIAKLLDPARTGPAVSLLVTQPEQRLMTPAYASPEQIAGETVTTASDVYSLGVILYELLTGRRPYSLENKPPQEVARLVCETEPTRPSVAAAEEPPMSAGPDDTTSPLRTGTGTAGALAALREGTPEKLRRRLEGDLDNIVLMALRKEPQRRYASVEQLSEDIRRHLESLPVIARPDTFAYRTAKFVRRNRVGVVAAALVFVALVAGVLGVAWQAIIASRARDKANTTVDYLERLILQTDVFDEEMPAGGGAALSALELIKRGLDKTEELASQPVVQARMKSVLAQAVNALGAQDRAIKSLDEALAIQRRLLGERNPDTLETMDLLGMVYTDLGQYDRAQEYLVPALKGRREVLGNANKKTIHSINNLARAYRSTERAARSLPLFLEALDLANKHLGETDADTLMIANNLAVFYQQSGESDRAIELLRDVLRKCESNVKLERNSAKIIYVMNNLGTVLKQEKRYAEALPLLTTAMEVRRHTLPEGHPYTINSMFRLADLYRLMNRHNDAVALLRESINAEMKSHTDGDQYLVKQFNQRYFQSEPDYGTLLEGVAKDYSELTGTEAIQTLQTAVGLADHLVRRKAYGPAEALLRHALETAGYALKPAEETAVAIRTAYADLCTKQARYADAENHLVVAHTALEKALGRPHARTCAVAARLASLYLAWTKPDKAEPILRELVRLELEDRSDADSHLIAYLNQLSKAMEDQGAADGYTGILAKVIADYRARSGDDAVRTLRPEAALAGLLVKRKDFAGAETLLKHTMGIAASLKPDDEAAVSVQTAYAELDLSREHFADAEQRLQAIHEVLGKTLGPEHRRVRAVESRLAKLYDAWGKPERAAEYRSTSSPKPEDDG